MKTYMSFTNIKCNSLLVLGLILIISGCKKDPVDWYRPIGNPLNSNVKFINTLIGPKMDFYTYTTKITSGIGYGDTNVPYVKTPFGNIIVYGTNFNNTSYRVTGNTNSSALGNQGLVADFYQTMFACKVFATNADSIAGAEKALKDKVTLVYETMILLRDNLTPPAAGKAHIRFVHLAQGGTTDIKSVDFSNESGIIFPKVGFQKASNSIIGLTSPGVGIYTSGPFTPVDAGVYTFNVKAAGTEDLVTSKTVNLVSGKIYTLYTVGVIGSTGANAIALKVLGH